MVTLTNVGTNYDTMTASRALGLALIDFRGATTIRFVCSVQKVGTGTQSWQLWNETDGTEIGVHNDAGAAAIKTLDQAFSVTLNGIKLVRVRAKSTVSTDDPIFLGCAVWVDTP